jgi:diaminopimelate epimerase
MKMIAFNKFQGAGNDFIIIDNRSEIFNPYDHELIRKMCDRRFGIGADGLILINKTTEEYDFEMIYFNSDGFEGTMCGNGGRCAVEFARKHNIAGSSVVFKAIDGLHQATVEEGSVNLQMRDIREVSRIRDNYFINTGSPHYLIFNNDIDNLDVYSEGKKIRYSADFAPGGTNVNFIQPAGDGIYVRTYERGVEDETLSCGTGVTASAIAAVLTGQFVSSPVSVKTKGGNLSVKFNVDGEKITDVWLSGPATFVFEGKIEI